MAYKRKQRIKKRKTIPNQIVLAPYKPKASTYAWTSGTEVGEGIGILKVLI